jgi:hypothetical protein
MTRRPKKARAMRKPARKVAKPVKRAKTVKPAKKVARTLAKRKVTKLPLHGSLDEFVAASARMLGLKIDKAWLPEVHSHLEVTLGHSALVASFALPDETDPAPVFEA